MLLAIATIAVGCGGASGGGSGGGTTNSAPATLTLSCTLPPSGFTGVSFNGSCTASGGTAPYSYSINNGALPAGLTINPSTGVITGTPTSVGATPFTVMVTDSSSPAQTATQPEDSYSVGAGTLQLLCGITNGVINVPYSATCSGSGGIAPYAYAVSQTALPAGLNLNASTGAITGVPNTLGLYYEIIAVTDSSAPPQTVYGYPQILITDSGASGSIGINCNNVGAGNVGFPFSGSCTAYNGLFPISYSPVAGSLPPGLTLDPASGSIHGEPALAGTYSFTVMATDSSSPPHTGTQQVDNLVIGPRLPESGYVTVTATSGGIVNSTNISVSVP
jgi:hypothetical protein